MEDLNLLQPPDPSPPGDEPKNNSLSKTGILIWCLIAYAVIVTTGFFLPNPLGLNWGIIASLICVGHFYWSFDQIDAGEHAIVLFLGRVIFYTTNKIVEEGWILVPYPFFKIEKVTRGIIISEFGSPFTKRTGDDKIEEIKDDTGEFVDRQPFRPNFLGIRSISVMTPDQGRYPEKLRIKEINLDKMKELEKDPLHGSITPDPKFVFTFQIRDMSYFYRNIPGGDVQEKLANIAKMITDQCKTTISEIAGITTFGHFLANQEIVNGRLRFRIEILLGERSSFAEEGTEERRQEENNYTDLGVDLKSIRMKDPGLPLHVNTALSSFTAAGYRRDEAIRLSEGERDAATNKGVGVANARRELLKAEADGKRQSLLAEAEGLLKLIEVSGKANGLEVIRLKSLVDAMQNGNVTLLPTDLSAIASATAAVRGLIQGKSS